MQLHGRAMGACRTAVVVLHPHLLEILPLSATDGCVGGSFPAESPSRALGIQGEGKGVRPKASQSAKDFLIELPERDTSRLLKKATARREAGICGGAGFARTPTYADPSSSGLAFLACS